MRAFHTPADPSVRIGDLIQSWFRASADDDVEVRTGRSEDGAPAVMIAIGRDRHGFTVAEARIAADLAEKAMRKFGHTPEGQSLSNLIMALRVGADKAEKR